MIAKAIEKYIGHYRGFPLAIWLNIFAVFIATSGLILNSFFTLFSANVKALDVNHIGLIIGAGGAGGLLGSYLSGILCNFVTPNRISQLALLAFSVFMLLFAFVKIFLILLLLNFMSNFCLGLFRPANFMVIFAHCAKEDRTRVMAFYRLAFNVGLCFSVSIGGWLASVNFNWFFFLSSFLGLLAAGFLFGFNKVLMSKKFPRDESENKGKNKTSLFNLNGLRDVWKHKAFMLLGTLFLFHCLIFFQLRSTYAVYLNHVYNVTLRDLGLLLLINFVTIIFFEVPLMGRFKNSNPIFLALYGNLLVGLSVVILPFGHGYFFVALSILLWTIGEMLATSPFTVLSLEFSNPKNPSYYMGIFQSISSLALILAPSIGFYTYSIIGGNLLWMICGVITILMTFGFLRLAKIKQQQDG